LGAIYCVSSDAQRSKRHYWVKRQVIMKNHTVALRQWTLRQWIAGGAVTVGRSLSIGTLGTIIAANAVQAAPLEEFSYNPQTDQLSFVLPDGVTPRSFLMAQPARIVVDIPDTQIGDLPLEQSFSGAVKRVEVVQVQPQLARVILEMSPQAVFARGQTNLQNVGDAAPNKDRWVLKLLLASRPLAGAPTAPLAGNPATSPAPLAERAAQPIAAPPIAPKPIPIAAKPAPAVELPPGMESVLGASPLPNLPVVAPNSPVPPVVAAVPTPVAVPPPLPNLTPIAPSVPVPIARIPEASPLLNLPPLPTRQATIINRGVPNPNSPAAQITPTPVTRADLQPPALPGSSPLVSVPPLASIGVPSVPPTLETPPGLPPSPPLLGGGATVMPTLPTLQPGITPNSSVAVKPSVVRSNPDQLPPLPDVALGRPATPPVLLATLPPTSTLPPTALPVAPQLFQLPATGVVEFGQRLPGAVATAPQSTRSGASNLVANPTVVALDNLTTGGVVIPAGTLLSLRYDQPASLKLKSGQRQQGMFSLQSPIVDSQGRLLAAAGSSFVLGEFVTSGEGSQFTTQSLTIGNRNLALLAQSDVLRSTKQLSNNRLLQNSGIGAVAGAILGGLNGSVLGGAAAGAAITYAIAPKDTTLQPGQQLQVKLVQDFFAGR
jgi:AMIN domain